MKVAILKFEKVREFNLQHANNENTLQIIVGEVLQEDKSALTIGGNLKQLIFPYLGDTIELSVLTQAFRDMADMLDTMKD